MAGRLPEAEAGRAELKGHRTGQVDRLPGQISLVIFSQAGTDAARSRRRGDRMSAPGKAGAILPVEVRPK